MLSLTDSIIINSTPDRIRDTLVFYFQHTENYKLWHADHISCHWKKGKDFSNGSILIAEEFIHGKKHRLGFRIHKFDNKVLEYKMLFPFSLICSGGSFEFIPKEPGTEFVARLNFRPGWLLKVLFRNRIAGLMKHLKEEGQNLKEFIERK